MVKHALLDLTGKPFQSGNAATYSRNLASFRLSNPQPRNHLLAPHIDADRPIQRFDPYRRYRAPSHSKLTLPCCRQERS